MDDEISNEPMYSDELQEDVTVMFDLGAES